MQQTSDFVGYHPQARPYNFHQSRELVLHSDSFLLLYSSTVQISMEWISGIDKSLLETDPKWKTKWLCSFIKVRN